LIAKNLPMPNSLYFELATWSTINFTYTFQNERMLVELVAGAREPDKVARLLNVIRKRLGHRIAFTVEDGKIALSEADTAALPLGFIEPGLAAPATRAGFDRAIATRTERLFTTSTRSSSPAAPAACRRCAKRSSAPRRPRARRQARIFCP
jgi:hypothetical chaperone protein